MNTSEFADYLLSPSGKAAISHAGSILSHANPEEPDSVLLRRVRALGFPKIVAMLLFKRLSGRFPPVDCNLCGKGFRHKSVDVLNRPYCAPCERAHFHAAPTPESLQKQEARRAASIALLHGKIRRQPCSECGEQKAQMHHPDYSRPLFVEWLCARCHAAEHKRLRAAA